MAKIEYDGWTPYPNSILDNECKDTRLPLKERVHKALFRLILGFDEGRSGNSRMLALRQIIFLTKASRRGVMYALEQLELEGKLYIERNSKGRRNTYGLEIDDSKWIPQQ